MFPHAQPFPSGLLLAAVTLSMAPPGCAPRTAPPAPRAQGASTSQASTSQATSSDASPATPAEPGIPLGSSPADATLLDESGRSVTLSSLHADRPIVIAFYRGGWCPFCTKALAQWQTHMPALREAGADFVAITPEAPEFGRATKTKIAGADYRVLCDDTMAAARAFKVAFRMDPATQAKYRTYGIDLSKHNAVGEWDLPAPATFVLDRQGRVRYAFASWDYTRRADPVEVIRAVRALEK